MWGFADAGVEPPFAERWNGDRWTLKRMPVPVGAHQILIGGLSCSSKRVCVAVGAFRDATRQFEALVEGSR